jgi:trimeric autotransporter adhesin
MLHVYKKCSLYLKRGLLSSAFLLLSTFAFAQVTYTVNSMADHPDIDLSDNICADSEGNCTLRAAIQNANKTTAKDRINFSIPGTAPFIIQISPAHGALPYILRPLIIDGRTQHPYDVTNKPVIEIDGTSLGAGFNGLEFIINANGSELYGLSIGGFQRQSVSPLAHGYAVLFATANNIVQSNYLGLRSDGSTLFSNTGGGIYADKSGNLFGGTGANQGNIVSGNTRGVTFEGSMATNNRVQGNLIGTDATGSLNRGNRFNVQLLGGASNNVIGGATAAARNIISGGKDAEGNDGTGISIAGQGTTANRIIGNYIGTDITGTLSIPNLRAGVLITFGPSENSIGGTAPGEGNLISGNGSYGVYLQGSATASVSSNSIQGNLIGTNAAGNAALANKRGIMMIEGVITQNLIGGTTAAARNIISGNSEGGITIAHGTENKIQGNYIGTNLAGTAAIANPEGISIGGSKNLIGGDLAGAGNLISGNTSAGIILSGSAATNNQVLGNLIGTNTAGTAAIANGAGISITNSARFNIIGGESIAARNIISGNNYHGVSLTATTSNNYIKGNYIGLDKNGTYALANARNGIHLSDSRSNIIGGPDPLARNIISGNSASGIFLGLSSTKNEILGNFIGTDASGIIAIPNDIGLLFDYSGANIVGGLGEYSGNLISGNKSDGIRLRVSANGNSVIGNIIGTTWDKQTPLGNKGNGILILNSSRNNIIGGAAENEGNTIAHNTLGGVVIAINESIPNALKPYNNKLSGNSMFSNLKIGIDLGDNGITDNDADDADDGPNLLQNFPVILPEATFNGSAINLSYFVSSSPTHSAYPIRVEFFIEDGNRQGKEFLYSEEFTSSDHAAGAAKEISFALQAGRNFIAGSKIVATATDANGNTSEFGAGVVVEEKALVYSLTVNLTGIGSVSRDPEAGNYQQGTEVTLTATADAGWQFAGWGGDLSGSTNPATITMDADKIVTAVFRESVENGYQGCTPGFWKNTTDWCGAYQQKQSFFAIFKITNTRKLGGKNGKLSLQDALDLKGGDYSKLARHATAALLNACNNGVNFPYTEQQIMDAVSEVFNNSAKNKFDADALGDLYDIANNAGCSLNNSNSNARTSFASQSNIPSQIVFYPNPISEQGFWLEFPVHEGKQNFNASLYEFSGRKLADKTFEVDESSSKQYWQLDHAAWGSGVYLLVVKSSTQVYQMKIIK